MKVSWLLLLVCAVIGLYQCDGVSVKDVKEDSVNDIQDKTEEAKTQSDASINDAKKEEEIPEKEAIKMITKIVEKVEKGDEENDEESDEADDEFDISDEDVADPVVNSLSTQISKAVGNGAKKGNTANKPAVQQWFGRRRRRRRRRRSWNIRRVIRTGTRVYCCWKGLWCCAYGKKKDETSKQDGVAKTDNAVAKQANE